MLDAKLRQVVDPALGWLGHALARQGISANVLTLAGAAVGVMAAVAISQGSFITGCGLVALNRLLDGLDGAVARVNKPTALGGYLDSLADFLFYVLVPVGFALVSPQNQLPALLLVASFTLTAVSFLAFAAIAARTGQEDGIHGTKAFIYSTGIIEGGETIAFFVIFCLFPHYFAWLALLLAGLCICTVIQRVLMAARVFA